MKKKVLMLLACLYLLATGVILAISLSSVCQFEHERSSLGQELIVNYAPLR